MQYIVVVGYGKSGQGHKKVSQLLLLLIWDNRRGKERERVAIYRLGPKKEERQKELRSRIDPIFKTIWILGCSLDHIII
jgi:hypothetical protein